MRTLVRNKRPFHYCLYTGKEWVTDSNGYQTGEYRVTYDTPTEMKANISAATGYSQVEQFGNFISYDKVIVTDDLNCPIDEDTVLFVDIPPTFDSDGNPLYDYRVRRVAKSLNSISIAISKVSVSGQMDK